MKIIFLDIDGPMIPATMLIVNEYASHHRIFPVTTIAVMNLLCENTGAKIVLNTTHNRPFPEVPDIEFALRDHGLNWDHLYHQDLKTRYPALRRAEAVTEWLARHPEVTHWVAMDDAPFTKEPNLILINGSAGISVDDMNAAAAMLEGKLTPVMM